jgi:hypothetical protein
MKLGPIWQVGQRVMARQMSDTGLGLRAFADIVVSYHPTAAGHRPFDDVHHAAIDGLDEDTGRGPLADPL